MKQQSLLDRFQIGQLALSKQGRDKNRLYVVTAKDDRFIYAADGSKWTVDRPKKKNAAHLQLIGITAEHQQGEIRDADIIQAIRAFENRKGI